MKRRSWGAVQPLGRSPWPFIWRFGDGIIGDGITGDGITGGGIGVAIGIGADVGPWATSGSDDGTTGGTGLAGIGGRGGAAVSASCARSCSGTAVSDAVAGCGSGPT